MSFKNFINEMEGASAPSLIDSINEKLSYMFETPIASPEASIMQVASVLSDHGLELSAIFGLDPEGDEVVIDVDSNLHLYMIYTADDNGLYDFYAEVVDDEGLEEILKDDEDEEE